MIFKDLNEFSIDLTDKILAFVSEGNYEPHKVLAIIKSYLHETKSIGEIDNFTIEFNNNQFEIYIYKQNNSKFININTLNEFRKRKLKAIKDEKKDRFC